MPRDYRAEFRARNARARAAGFDNYYAQRIALGRREGFTRPQAAGHPARGEISASEYRAVERDLLGAARAYVTEAPVHVRSAKTGRKLKRTETQTILITIDERGKMRTRVFSKDKAKSLRKTVEKRNRVRKRRRLPDLPLPEETP